MKITAIKQQEKLKDRYSIFVDDKYSFSLSESELLAQGLKLNQELSASELDEMKQQAKIDKGVYRVMGLIARRPRSEWEVSDYLKRKGYDEDEVSSITSKIKDKGYIDDEKFALAWTANRRLLKPISNRKLVLELKQKRVAGEIIDKILSENPADEVETLKNLIEKKRKTSRYQDEQKLIAYLARQGFNYGDIKEALNDQEGR